MRKRELPISLSTTAGFVLSVIITQTHAHIVSVQKAETGAASVADALLVALTMKKKFARFFQNLRMSVTDATIFPSAL
jgi:hypothetical protein